MDLSDKWGTHSSALFNVELALGQGHTLRGSAEKLGARSMNHPKMREITGWKLQYTEVVRQGGGRATKWDGALAAEHPSRCRRWTSCLGGSMRQNGLRLCHWRRART